MAEPDQIEFHERVGGPDGGQPGSALTRSIPVRIGIVAGSAILFVVGAVAAMGASSSPTSSTANAGGVAVPGTPFDATMPNVGPAGGSGFDSRGGGFGMGGFRNIMIKSIDGSSLVLQTDDGWARTITIGSSTTITRGGQSIKIGDLKAGDQIVFGQSKASDGSYTITAIQVVLPAIGGQVTAVGTDTITLAQKGGSTGTIHVAAGTTYDVNGNASAKLSDITVGSFVLAQGTRRSDGSLDAAAVHGGSRGGHDGGWGGPGFRVGPDDDQTNPNPNPNATPTTPSSAS